MSEVVIKVRKNGPYQVTGPIRLVDHDGNPLEVEAGDSVFLCRCGQSGEKPICDGTHKKCGWVDTPESEPRHA